MDYVWKSGDLLLTCMAPAKGREMGASSATSASGAAKAMAASPGPAKSRHADRRAAEDTVRRAIQKRHPSWSLSKITDSKGRRGETWLNRATEHFLETRANGARRMGPVVGPGGREDVRERRRHDGEERRRRSVPSSARTSGPP